MSTGSQFSRRAFAQGLGAIATTGLVAGCRDKDPADTGDTGAPPPEPAPDRDPEPEPWDPGLTEDAVAYRALRQDPADGKVEASGSQLLMAITPPPAETGVSYSFFGQIVEEDLGVLSSLTISDTIQTITITEE